MSAQARRTLGFWLVALTATAFFAASSAPSPLYVVYQSRWHFSATVLTLVFASYALALLLALLTIGGLSDFVGRRPVIAVSLLVEIVSMLFFLRAGGVGALFVARIVQGLATGAAAGALSAALTDMGPSDNPTLAPAINTAAPSIGLAIGAVASGGLVQYGPAPRSLIFAILTGLFVAMLVALVAIPESGQRRSGVLRSLRPRAAVPATARTAFLIAAPVLVATWAVGGLVLSLGPSLAAVIFGIHNHLVGGLVVSAVSGVGALSSVLVRTWDARATMTRSVVVLAAGVAVLLVGLETASTTTFFIGLVISGAGFGAAFVASIASVAPLAGIEQRAELFAALFIVSYGSFGGSAVLAGLVVPSFGLRPTALVYGLIVIALALGVALMDRRTRTPVMATA